MTPASLIKEVMVKEVVTVRPEMTLQQVSRLFFERHISGAPVVDDEGKMLGVISETDVLKAVKTYEKRLSMVYPSASLFGVSFQSSYKETEMAEAIARIQDTKVQEVMTRDVYVLGPEDTIQRAVLIMNAFGVNRIPVVEGTRVVGILTRADIIRYLGTVDMDHLIGTSSEKPKSG